MKVVHIPFCFYPDAVGGTEVYVASLAREQQRRGIEVIIAAPAKTAATYHYEGLRVHRYLVRESIEDLSELYGEGDPAAAEQFGHLLDDVQPDIVHLHAFTRAVSVRLVRAAHKRHIPVVFTYHTPTVSCSRGTLLRWGREICDGVLDIDRCTRCVLHGHGLPRPVAEVIGRVPVATGQLLGAAKLSGGPWTALRMRSLIGQRQAAFQALMAEVDGVVALGDWTKALLEDNGVPAAKITVSRHGLAQLPGNGRARQNASPLFQAGEPLRIAFLGRLHPTKGPDLLINAIRALPKAALALDLYGIVQGASGNGYLEQLQDLAAGDSRIRFCPPVSSDQVIALLQGYHLLAVPSRILETGPLVVLEAFAAGIPVIGSELGGIAEHVRNGVDGMLVKLNNLPAWIQILQTVIDDLDLIPHLRQGVRPPRIMAGVAQEMNLLYGQLLTGQINLMPAASGAG